MTQAIFFFFFFFNRWLCLEVFLLSSFVVPADWPPMECLLFRKLMPRPRGFIKGQSVANKDSIGEQLISIGGIEISESRRN